MNQDKSLILSSPYFRFEKREKISISMLIQSDKHKILTYDPV